MKPANDTRESGDQVADCGGIETGELLTGILSSIQDGISILDTDLRILKVNSVMKRWFGLTDEVTGRPCREVFPDSSVSCIECPSRKAIETGTIQSGLFPSRFVDGTGDDWVEVFSHPLRDGRGKITGVIEYVRDVTTRVHAEQALRMERDIFAGMAEASPSGIVRVSKDGVISYANRRASEILEYPVMEIEGARFDSPLWRITSPQGGTIPFDEIPARILDDRSLPIFDVIYAMTLADGRRKILSVNAAPLESPLGGTEGIVATLEDVTERFDAQESVRLNEQFNRALIAESPIGISVRSASGRLLSCNRAWQQIWNMTDSDVASDMERERESLVLDDRDRYLGDWIPEVRRVYEEGGSLHVPEMKTSGKRPGSATWISQHFYAIMDSSGRVDRVVILTEDISEQRAVEQALKENEARYRTLTESSHDLIFAIDADDTIRFVNSAAANAFGMKPSDLVGRKRSEFFRGEDSGTQVPALMSVLSGGKSYYAENSALFPTGKRWLGTWLVPLEDIGGGSPGVLGVSRDISDRVRAEEREANLREQLNLSQRMESIGRLAGGVAHDFNNLLTVILGHAELAIECAPSGPHPVRTSLLEIRKAGERARDLTWQLLAFGRRQMLVMKEIDLNRVIASFSSILLRLIGEDVRIETDLDPALSTILADPGQIEQVLMNLAVNARDAMPSGGTLRISTREALPDDPVGEGDGGANHRRYAELVVSDTGTGMDEETLRHVFEPFFTTKEVGRGTGLGLSTVYGIVKQHGGFVRVESRPGAGTAFSVFLPLSDVGVKEIPQVEQAEVETPAGPPRIMVVEDDKAVRELICGLLRHEGYSVVAVEDPAAAGREASSRGRFDLLVTDVVMPGMGGREVASAVLAADPSIRVLFISGYSSDMADLGFPRTGTGFLQKPFSAAKLIDSVKTVLRDESSPGTDR